MTQRRTLIDADGRFGAMVAVLLLMSPAGVEAQDTITVAQDTVTYPADTITVGATRAPAEAQHLPREVAEDVIDLYNRPTTFRLSGRTRIPWNRSLEGDVVVLGGPVELAGRVHGDMAVVNGDLHLREGARIDGDVIVVGGVIAGIDVGEVGGTIETYSGTLRYRRTPDGKIAYVSTERSRPRPSDHRIRLPAWTLGDSEIHVSSGSYNRVEGLPIVLGPRITTGGHNPALLEALVVYRTERGLDVDDRDLGYRVRARQYLGGHEAVWAELALHSIIDPIETWQLTDLENSLSLFLFRRDYRDYYEREGWSGTLGWKVGRTFFGSVEYRDEDHRSEVARTPWTILFNTDEEFAPNALVDGGDLRSVILTVGLDTRNDRDDPWAGWYNQLSVERSLTGLLADREPNFTHFFLDLRRYNRVSPGASLALRLVTGGRAGGGFLPAQRQHVIGGVGSLPGFDPRQFDCGVRSQRLIGNVAGYGCQRFALFQAEYRGDLDFDFTWGDGDVSPDIFTIDFEPDIVFFYGAGAAWDTDEAYIDHLTESDNWVADIGAGFELGGLGLYLAYPLAGPGGFNFFVRLSERF